MTAPQQTSGVEPTPMSWAQALRPVPGRRYPLVVALASAGAVAFVTACVGVNRVLPAYLAWAIVGTTIAVVDAHTRLIPNKLVALGLTASVPLLVLADNAGDGSVVRAAAGAAAAFAVYAVLNLLAPAGLGMGDVKFAPYLGAHLAFVDWLAWTRGLLAGFVVQAAIIIVLVVARRVGRRSMVPHGPAMWLGALLAFWASVGFR